MESCDEKFVNRVRAGADILTSKLAVYTAATVIALRKTSPLVEMLASAFMNFSSQV